MQHPQQNIIPPPLPPGWIVATDPVSGRIYYANPTTGQTSWDPPAVIPTPPPPPPPPPQRYPTATAIIASTTTHQPYAPTNQNSNVPSVVAMNPTLNASGLLIPSARAIINKANMRPNNSTTKDSPVELYMTGGMISDLAKVQSNYRYDQMIDDDPSCEMSREEVDNKHRYEPLKPFELPVASTVPHVEAGRVDIRLMTLMDTLSKIENHGKK